MMKAMIIQWPFMSVHHAPICQCIMPLESLQGLLVSIPSEIM